MIIEFSLLRLSIIFLLVILFPLVQKQWLNLYLFDINNFTIYKLLYYLSGLIAPIFITINSLNKFTYYKFNYHRNNNNKGINGKLLFLIILILLSTLSILISNYIFINLKLFLNIFISKNEHLVQLDIDKQILFVVIISTLLIFEKAKYLIKKVILLNFFIFSIIAWYSYISSSFVNSIVPLTIYKSGSINFINIAFLLALETVFYLWGYFSYSTYLSDWNVPSPYKKEIWPILNIFIFYFLIFLYYSILLR